LIPGDTYQPIACAQHERLEFAVLRRIPLWLRYQAEAGQQLEELILPLDVQTRQTGEWLVLRYANGNTGELRLDQLQYFEERPSAGGSDKN
jgi:Rho-binding antiterminator